MPWKHWFLMLGKTHDVPGGAGSPLTKICAGRLSTHLPCKRIRLANLCFRYDVSIQVQNHVGPSACNGLLRHTAVMIAFVFSKMKNKSRHRSGKDAQMRGI